MKIVGWDGVRWKFEKESVHKVSKLYLETITNVFYDLYKWNNPSTKLIIFLTGWHEPKNLFTALIMMTCTPRYVLFA